MSGETGYFLPINSQKNCFQKVRYNIFEPMACKPKPFFGVLNEDSTVKLFLDCIANRLLEDASVYISKNLVNRIDLQEVQRFLTANRNYKYLIKANVSRQNKNCKTNSVLIINEEFQNSIIHLHLIREPDHFGNWKIYRIENE